VLQVFLEVVLPVALIAAVGGLLGRWRAIPVAPVSTLVFYLFSPALVFTSLANTELTADVSLRIVLVMGATFLAMYAVASAFSLARRHDRPLRAAVALAITIPNTGNMGLPVALLAFGQAGLDVAVMNYVVGAVIAYSAGIAIASMVNGTAMGALRAPFRYPVVYAAVIGALVNAADVTLPVTIAAPIETLGDAAVPVMLVVLGLQMQSAVRLDHLFDTGAAVASRLLVAPVVSWCAATALGLEGTTRDTLVVLAAMPTAVIAIVLATEFHARPTFVTRAVVASTVASMATVTVLIAVLQ